VHVEPVPTHPPATSRTLAEWLDPELAARYGVESRTRLREIADARAMRRGMWGAFVSLGASSTIVGLGILALGVTPSASVPWAIAGVIVAAVAALFLRRERGWIPRPGKSYTTRGAGDLRGGVIAALSLFVVFNVFLIPAMMSAADPVPLLVLDGACALLLVSGFVVPAAILGRGREALRRQVRRDPRVAAALEAERLTWNAGVAVTMFGPL
jgi:amino acid transporter